MFVSQLGSSSPLNVSMNIVDANRGVSGIEMSNTSQGDG